MNAAGGLFGNNLIDANARVGQRRLDDTLFTAIEGAENEQRGTIDASRAAARSTFFKSLQDAKIGTAEKQQATDEFTFLEGMTLDEKKRERDRLILAQSTNKTERGGIELRFLNKTINDETLAREKSAETILNATDDHEENSEQLKLFLQIFLLHIPRHSSSQEHHPLLLTRQ